MMRMMGYDLIKVKNCASTEGEALPCSPVYQKNIDYYNKTKHSLGYTSSDLEMNALQENILKEIQHTHPKNRAMTLTRA